MAITLKVEKIREGFYQVHGYMNGEFYGVETGGEHFDTYEEAINWAENEALEIGANLQTTYQGVESSVKPEVGVV